MSKTQKDDKQVLSKLAGDFHELVSNRETLRTSVEKFLDTIIDELTLGIIFDLHRKYKTNSYDLEMADEEPDEGDEAPTEVDIFTQHDLKKTQDCVCPNCDRAVAATRFAPHLEACMGMGRSRSRNATRRVATSNSKDRENTSFSGVPSDDEDDIDWNSGNKRGKKKKRNGNKKAKGTPKKGGDSKSADTNVEVEIEEDELSNLRDILQDHSNSSSPAESVSSSQSNSSKRKEKTKNKKSKRDRSSPSSSIAAD